MTQSPVRGRTTEARAWAWLAANTLVLPGLGSILGGRFLAGALQAVASVVGFGLTMYWSLSWLRTAVTESDLPTGGGPLFGFGVSGLLLFGAAWVSGLFSGLALVREARRSRPS